MTWSRAKNMCTCLCMKKYQKIIIFSGDLWPDRGPSTTSWTHCAGSRSLLSSSIQVLLTLLRIMLILLVMLLRIMLILMVIRTMSVTTWSQHPVIFKQTWVFALLKPDQTRTTKPDQSWSLRFWNWIWKQDLTFSPNVTANLLHQDGMPPSYKKSEIQT